MNKQEKSKEEQAEKINLEMLNIALSPMGMISPVVPLILEDEEEKEDKEEDKDYT
ncbi:MAG: hypothetical protein AB6733_11825 [Clostridiaceae bacterium]